MKQRTYIDRAAGFTLLELLVSMALFSLLAVIMYSGTQLVMDEREVIAERLGELEELQRAVRGLQTDLVQIYPRTVRDSLGRDILPALLTDERDGYTLQFTRTGWRNPAKVKRSSLQRVQYRYDEDEEILYREYWPVLDGLLSTEEASREILYNVTDFEVEFLDANGTWNKQWPATGTNIPSALPFAIKYRFKVKSYGDIERLVELAG